MGVSVQRCRAPLAGLLIANVISVLGGAMSVIALPWFVYATTGSAALTGVAALCETLPIVGMSVVSGGFVRRLGAWRTRVWSDVIAGVAVLGIPLLHSTVGIAYWQLLVLLALNGALRAPAVAASLVMLRNVTALAGLSPDQTTGPYSASVRLASSLGAPAAGVLIAAFGAPTVLVADAVTFLASAGVIWLLIPVDTDPADCEPADPGPRRALSDLAQGFTVLRHDSVLALVVGFGVVVMLISASWGSVAAPIYGQTVLGSATQLGLLFGIFGGGALVGNLVYVSLSRRASPYVILSVALAISGPLLWATLAAQPPLGVLAAVMSVAGAAFGVMPPLQLTLQYARVDPADQGHIFGLTFGLETAGQAVGAAVGGLILAVVSLPETLWMMSIASAGLTIACLLAPPLRRLQREPGPRGTA